jgi:hypothetical protein
MRLRRRDLLCARAHHGGIRMFQVVARDALIDIAEAPKVASNRFVKASGNSVYR